MCFHFACRCQQTSKNLLNNFSDQNLLSELLQFTVLPVAPSGTQWHPVAPSGTQWHPVVPSGTQWHPVAPSGTQWHPVAPSGTQWHPVAPSGTQWHPVAPSGTQWHPVAPSGTLQHRESLMEIIGFSVFCHLHSLLLVSCLDYVDCKCASRSQNHFRSHWVFTLQYGSFNRRLV